MEKLANVAVIYLNDDNGSAPILWDDVDHVRYRARGNWCLSPVTAIKKDYAVVVNNCGGVDKEPYIAEVFQVSGVKKVPRVTPSSKDKIEFFLDRIPVANEVLKLRGRPLLVKKAQGDAMGIANGEIRINDVGNLELWRNPTTKGSSAPKRIA